MRLVSSSLGNMTIFRGFLIAVATLMVAGLTSCRAPHTGDAHLEQNIGVQPLRVGIAPNSPPIIYKEGSNFVGLEADLARALGARLNRPVRFVTLEWDNLIPALQHGDIDIIMSGMSITPARDMRVAFVSPYMRIGQIAVFNNRDVRRYVNRVGIQMSNDRVGVETGTTADLYLQQAMPNAKRFSYSSSRDAIHALLDRKVGMVICDAPTAIWLASEKESHSLTVLPQLLTTEEIAWAVRRDNRSLHLAVNAVLRSWKETDALRPVIRRWIPYYDQLQQTVNE